MMLGLELGKDWQTVVRKAWSIRLILLAAALSAVEVWFQIFGAPLWMPLGVFAGLSAVTSAGAFAARIVAQKEITHADQ
jgi:uncharacterized transporter YbjL